jgi:hypothetical protein
MKTVKVVLCHLPEDMYRIYLEDDAEHQFNLEAYNSIYLDIEQRRRKNYNFAYNLANWLKIDFQEVYQ